jgi:hypothetical protein
MVTQDERINRLERIVDEIRKPKPKKKAPEPVARGARSGIQAGPGFYLAGLLAPHLPHLVPHQRLILAIALTALIGYIQVAVENRLGKAFLRDIPHESSPLVDTDKDS